MLDAFLKFIDENRLIKKNDRVLVTVSGGIDSMVMADLFIRAGIDIGIAHCNFSLRAKESDLDEELVRELTSTYKIPFFSKKFDTKAYSLEKGISIQMAARELRYAWFEEIRKKNKFDSVAVAHNLNDNIETFLINLTRGTGIAGLSGMKKAANRIIRPLLFTSRREISEYCTARKIVYREDQSNAETKYTRNKIRHQVIPLLKEINPSIEITLNETAERLSGINEVFAGFIEEIRERTFEDSDDSIGVNISKLQPFLCNNAILFELFRPFGINHGILRDIFNIIKGKSGSQIITESHRIIKNRRELVIRKISYQTEDITVVKSLEELRQSSRFRSVRIIALTEYFKIPADPDIACIDLQKISFPFTIRKWQHGDYFYPFGMNRKKKLSDYFIDRKFSLPEKENALLLESAGKIVWIIGERLDNRFRITPSTKRALILKSNKIA
jgi:tRNA(Ile)-lysidine synthase